MRVLHLIDPQSSDGGPCTLRLLADAARHMRADVHDALILGGAREVELAARCGVSVSGSLCPPRALPWAGAKAIRRFAVMKASHGAAYDLIHAWTLRTAALAALAFGSQPPSLATLHVGPPRGLFGCYARRAMRRGKQPLLAACTAVRRECKVSGLSSQQAAILPPAVSANSAELIDRDAVRDRWVKELGLKIEPDAYIVGLLGEPPQWIDARIAANVADRVRLTGCNIKLLMHPSCWHRLQAQQGSDELGHDEMMILDEAAAEPWRIVKGLDAAMMLGRRSHVQQSGSMLPVLWALAAGLPVVAARSDALRDVIEDEVNGLLVNEWDVNAASERLARLAADRDLARRLGENARGVAEDMFSIDSYCIRLKHAYDLLLAGRTVRTVGNIAEPFDLTHDAPVIAHAGT